MIHLIGIAILILGFFIPPLSQETVPAQIVFWAGFYLILRFGKVAARHKVISRSALIGMTFHIAAVLIIVPIGKYVMYPGTWNLSPVMICRMPPVTRLVSRCGPHVPVDCHSF